MVLQHTVLNGVWMRPSFLENYLENREGNTNWTEGDMGTRRKYKVTPNSRNIFRFPRVQRERRHSVNTKFLLSTYYVPDTFLEHP